MCWELYRFTGFITKYYILIKEQDRIFSSRFPIGARSRGSFDFPRTPPPSPPASLPLPVVPSPFLMQSHPPQVCCLNLPCIVDYLCSSSISLSLSPSQEPHSAAWDDIACALLRHIPWKISKRHGWPQTVPEERSRHGLGQPLKAFPLEPVREMACRRSLPLTHAGFQARFNSISEHCYRFSLNHSNVLFRHCALLDLLFIICYV